MDSSTQPNNEEILGRYFWSLAMWILFYDLYNNFFCSFCSFLWLTCHSERPTELVNLAFWRIMIYLLLFLCPQKTAKKNQKMSIINRNSPVVQKGPRNWPIRPCDVSWYICCNETLSPIQGADGRCKPLDICLLSLFFLWKRMKIRLDKYIR